MYDQIYNKLKNNFYLMYSKKYDITSISVNMINVYNQGLKKITEELLNTDETLFFLKGDSVYGSYLLRKYYDLDIEKSEYINEEFLESETRKNQLLKKAHKCVFNRIINFENEIENNKLFEELALKDNSEKYLYLNNFYIDKIEINSKFTSSLRTLGLYNLEKFISCDKEKLKYYGFNEDDIKYFEKKLHDKNLKFIYEFNVEEKNNLFNSFSLEQIKKLPVSFLSTNNLIDQYRNLRKFNYSNFEKIGDVLDLISNFNVSVNDEVIMELNDIGLYCEDNINGTKVLKKQLYN